MHVSIPVVIGTSIRGLTVGLKQDLPILAAASFVAVSDGALRDCAAVTSWFRWMFFSMPIAIISSTVMVCVAGKTIRQEQKKIKECANVPSVHVINEYNRQHA